LIFDYVPPGLGRKGFLKVNKEELKRLVEGGVPHLVKKGIGWEEDVSQIEEDGKINGADFSYVSKEAVERGISQLATLGSGNHYLEIQVVDTVFDQQKAKEFGISEKNQIVVMVHCGSRGFGHQICSDYLRIFEKHMLEFKVALNDRQLISAPLHSSPAKNYLSAMAAAANFAFVNREAITHQIRIVFEKVFGKKAQTLGMELVYDVAHNIAKFEEHLIPNSSKKSRFLIHRKGATCSFPNQPVIIGGSMETGSYLLFGTEKAMEKSFGSTAHGSGRTMSRTKAKKIVCGEKLFKEMKTRGIYVKSASYAGLAEEAGLAYKNISAVVKSIDAAGLSKPVAYLKPIGNIKG
jgi:tRNA-splicing ligase RtcB